MRPVNLLPQSARPYEAGGKSGGAYVLVGVLAALVLAVAAYVLTSNQITSHKNDIKHAQDATAQANAKADGLQRYGQFAQVAATRILAVGTMATNRIDYERLLRETARVLPDGVWLTSLDAEASGGDASSTGSTSTTTTTPISSPTVHLVGCAPTQAATAVTLVRLRALHGSGDVQLNDSGKTLDLSGGGSGSSAGGGSSCGNKYSFDILVTLTPEITGFGDIGRKVPASLGGGS